MMTKKNNTGERKRKITETGEGKKQVGTAKRPERPGKKRNRQSLREERFKNSVHLSKDGGAKVKASKPNFSSLFDWRAWGPLGENAGGRGLERDGHKLRIPSPRLKNSGKVKWAKRKGRFWVREDSQGQARRFLVVGKNGGQQHDVTSNVCRKKLGWE